MALKLNIYVRVKLHLQNGMHQDGALASPTKNLQASMIRVYHRQRLTACINMTSTDVHVSGHPLRHKLPTTSLSRPLPEPK